MLFYNAKKPIQMSVIRLNDKKDQIQKSLKEEAGSNDQKSILCKIACRFKKDKKENNKSANTVFVMDFIGDIKANDTEKLREEVSAILSVAQDGDEVIVRLESSGGQVHSYGLAAAQLARIKEAGIKLTICVDKVAASGGYMMACVADKIIAAPFAIVGSIGVVSQMPNFHDFLKKHDIDIELFTAGEYKRTVTMLGKNSNEDRAKYQSELERIHELFQQHISTYRQNLDVAKVATGEFWFGSDAKDLDLVDELGVSDSYILEKMKSATVLMLHSHQKPTLIQKLGLSEQGALMHAFRDNLPKVYGVIDKVVAKL